MEIRRAEDRGSAEFGWLHSRHTFSFGQYRDPNQMGFSDLLVINDDRVEPGQGFGTHPHRDMEIFSFILEGALAHRDSMGTGSTIHPGEVQMMSAGTGITHSEFNASRQELVHFLQIWIVPDRKGVAPRYQQKQFPTAEKRGRLRLVISPDGANGSLSVYQDTRVYSGLFDGAESAELRLPAERFGYVHVAKGEIALNGEQLRTGDGARLRREAELKLSQGRGAEVLIFDLRPNELP
jgi:redox-sensitive bicupin YhaK (pirin superfamily)